MASRRLDSGFIGRPVSEHGGITFDIVASEPLLVALPSSHPLPESSRRGGVARVRLRDLADESFILVRRPGAPGMHGDLIEACRKVGYSPNVIAEVDQMLTNVTLVAAGVGVSVVPASMRDIHHQDVCYAEAAVAPRTTTTDCRNTALDLCRALMRPVHQCMRILQFPARKVALILVSPSRRSLP